MVFIWLEVQDAGCHKISAIQGAFSPQINKPIDLELCN